MSSAEINRCSSKQAYGMAVICLLVGVAGGYFIRSSGGARLPNQFLTANEPSASRAASRVSRPAPSPAQMKQASAQAASTVLQQLASSPNDFQLLIRAGEMYYQHGAFVEAAGYYERALKVQDNVTIRNQYASALFYIGEADGALREYARVLKSEPGNDIALFNSGMVKFKAKHDPAGAAKLWRELLRRSPNHPQRVQVEKMIERASSSLYKASCGEYPSTHAPIANTAGTGSELSSSAPGACGCTGGVIACATILSAEC